MRLKTLAPSAMALLFLLAPTPVRAEVEIGAEAPEVEAQEFVNSEPVKLSELKGRLVLLELFATT